MANVEYPQFKINGGGSNTLLGFKAGKNITTGTENVAIGSIALEDNTTGSGNTAVGRECLMNNIGGGSNTAVGKLALTSNSAGSNFWQNGITPHQFSDSWNYTIMYRSDGLVLNLPNSGTSTGNTSFAANDIMGMAYDSSARTLKFYKNGSLVLTKTVNVATPAGDYFFGAGATNGGTYISDWNFGGYTSYTISSAASDANGYGTFEYAPPTGYYALCTKNLAEYG